jgi:CBS domain-containing protein
MMDLIHPPKKKYPQELITIGVDQSVFEAHKLMRQSWIRHLPVVDEQGEIVGIVSERDINNMEYSGRKVSEVMSVPVFCIDHEASMIEAAQLMLNKKISCVLVTDHQQVLGIVTTDDLLKSLIFEKQTVDSQTKLSLLLRSPSLNRIVQTLSDMGV